MIKVEELLLRMTNAQKIALITSREKFKTTDVDDFLFPVFSFKKNPLDDYKDKFATIFPKTKMLGNSWNLDLVKEVNRLIGLETKVLTENSIYNISADNQDLVFSEDPYLNGLMISKQLNGFNEALMPNSIHNLSYKAKSKKLVYDCDLLSLELEIKNGNPNSIILDNIDEIKFVDNLNYDGIIFSTAKDKFDAIKKINNGASLIFIDEDITEFVIEAINKYEKMSKLLKENKLTKYYFDSLIRNGEIISVNKINQAFIKMLKYLDKTKSFYEEEINEEKISNGTNQTPLFNEILHSRIALEAARESVVLLKNEDILPIKHTLKVGIIGDFAINSEYQINGFTNTPTAFKTPYELINLYDIEAVCFTYGYKSGKNKEKLLDDVSKVINKCDTVIVYLYAYNKSKLPDEQIELLKALQNKVKVIAVLTTNRVIDMSFDYLCDAIILSNFAGQAASKAILDILIGDYNPHGKLAISFDNIDSKNYPKYQYLKYHDLSIKYPFGYGLSYSKFIYKNLKINEIGVEFSIENTTEYDGYATPLMFVKSPIDVVTNYSLKGFKKVFIRKFETVRCFIPFDKYTFRSYFINLDSYGIKEGIYKIYIQENSQEILLEGEIMQNEEIDKIEFRNDIEEIEDMEKFSCIDAKREIPSRKSKIVFTSILLAYIVISTIILEIVSENFIGRIFIGSIGLILAIILIILLIMFKKKKEVKTISLIDDYNLYANSSDIARVTYSTQFEEVKEVIEKIEEETAEVTYDRGFEDEVDELKESSISINKIYQNLSKFLENNGYIIETKTSREIIAAIASSNIIVLKSTSYENLLDLSKLINKFFNINIDVLDLKFKDICEENLLWENVNGVYKKTLFAQELYKATLNNNLYIKPITGINESFKEAFKKFIMLNSSPKLEQNIQFSDNEVLTLPKNMVYLLLAKENELDNLDETVIYINVEINKIENNTESETIDINYQTIKDELKELKESYYLNEDKWKKFDELVEFINRFEKFEINNKKVIQMENYSALLLASDLSEVEVIDSCLSNLFTDLKNLKLTKNIEQLNNLIQTLERLFTEDGIKRTRQNLK